VAVSHIQKPYTKDTGGRAAAQSSPWVGKAQPAVSTTERWPGCCTSVSEIRAEQIRGPGRIGTKYGEATLA